MREASEPLQIVLESKDELFESGRREKPPPPRISPKNASKKLATESSKPVSHRVTVNESLRGSSDTEP